MNNPAGQQILLAHGGGGQLTGNLIRNTICSRLGNKILNELGDSANLNLDSPRICFTTDSYVVKPLFFNGGDIGKLAVCGTINDLAVAGARPVALSLSFIIETGFDFHLFEKIIDSIAKEAKANNVDIVTGDTKTVEAGAADGIFINTAGIGIRLEKALLGFQYIKPGDKIILSGTIGDHGMTIISQREEIKFQSDLKSDCAALAPLTCQLLESQGADIKFMRDVTRGGLAAVLNEISAQTHLSIEINQGDIPINPTVQAAADALGFDILNIANEGKFIAVVSPNAEQTCLDICRKHSLGQKAAVIGSIAESAAEGIVEMKTTIGGRRIVPMPYGRELPRIC